MLGRRLNGTPSPAEELAAKLDERGYRPLLTSFQGNRYLRLLDIVLTLIRRRKQIDTVCLQVYGGPSFVVEDVASRLAHTFGHRLVMVLHGGAMPPFMTRFPTWSRRVLRRADLLITPSQYLADFIRKQGFSCCVIPNALDLTLYQFRHRKEVKPRLVWLRALHRIYQPEMAIKVLRDISCRFPDASLIMAGPDKKDGSLEAVKKLARELGLADRLQIAGGVSKTDVPNCLARGDIFLNTTLYESFGISVMEAAAVGLPIVTTNVGELQYLWKHGQDAMQVPPDDAIAMAAAVQQVLLDSGLSGRLSLNARRKAEQYDWSRVLPLWEAALNPTPSHSLCAESAV